MKVCKHLLRNDVPAEGQLKGGDNVSFDLTDGADLKILFLGNSITRHGVNESLGWFGDWGMAASEKERDYVHRLVKLFEDTGRKVSFCTANLSDWERTRDMSLLETEYRSAREFGAELIIVRLGENAGLAENEDAFEKCYMDMVGYFSADGAKVVLTDLFWEYEPFDGFVKELAKERGYIFVELHDLGDKAEMKAVGRFSHAGVDAHPGDAGMDEISQRIFRAAAGSPKF